jgi:ribonuclease G
MGKYKIFINNEKVLLRIIIEKDGKIENLFFYKQDFETGIGNIYKGKIEKFLPSLNSAFVNIGEMKSGFLQFDEKDFYFNENFEEEIHYKRSYFPEKDILIQVCKPGEDEKSPKLSEKIVLPGRYFVLLPNIKIQKISKKIKDEKERKKLMNIFKKALGENTGFIIRTAARTKKEIYIYREIKYLLNIWRKIKRDYKRKNSPSLLWKELPLHLKVLRDYVNEEFISVEVDDQYIFNEILRYTNLFIPELKGKIYLYKGNIPMFIKYGFEEKIDSFFSDKILLPSGGYLIIEKGKTLTAIDINSSRTEGKNFEETSLITNLEAVEEIPRQIRCRNISGIIIIDFINMREEENRKIIFKKFLENLKEDKAKIDITFSKLGLIELCREKNEYSIYNFLFKRCEKCNGAGFKKDKELIFIEMKKKFFEIFSKSSYNKFEILLSSSLYEFIFKNQLFKNFVFLDRIKFKIDSNLKEDEFKIIGEV